MRFRFLCVLALFAVFAAPAADDLETSVSLMAKIGSCGSPSFSPDGRRLAFVSNLSGVPQVWTVAAAGGWPTMVTALEDPVGFVTWSPDGQWLAFTSAPGGGMNAQVFLVHPDGSGLRRLTDGGKETNGLSVWSHDGKLLAFTSSRRDPRAIDAYTYDVASGQSRLVAKNPGVGNLGDVSRDRQWGVLDRLQNRGDNNLLLIDLAGGKETLLTPHDPPGTFGGGSFSPDGKTIYLASNQDRDRIAFAQIRLGADGKPGPIEVLAARDDAELAGLELTEDGRTAALLWNVSGRSGLSFFDLAARKETPGPKLPAEIAGGLNFSRDGRLLALSASGAAAPSDLWVLERATGRFRQVTRSPHAGVSLDSLVRPELVKFAARDGLPLSGWLYRPRGASGPGPVALSFHGGPEGQERPAFSSTYQALLARGIAVFAPNVRGSSGFGKKFVNLDNGALRENGVQYIEACVRYVVQACVADPKRVGILGGSYGGYMVMAGITEFPGLFAAGADLFGIVNFETFSLIRSRGWRQSRRSSTATPTPSATCSAGSRPFTSWTASAPRPSSCTAPTTPTCRWSKPSRW